MATTVTAQTTVIEAWDAVNPPVTTLGIGGVNAPNAGVTTPKAEGTRSTDGKVILSGVGGFCKNQGSTDVSTDHVIMWGQTLDGVNTKANDGWRIRLSSNTNGTTNYDEITVGGGDSANLRREGFSSFCCNALRDGENINGTPPAATAVISFCLTADHLTASNRFTWFCDEFKRGTGITLTAGTAGTPGTTSDVAADDVTNGTGLWMVQDGVNFLLGKVIIGDVTASTDSHFSDLLETWVFRDQPVKNDFHGVETVGGTGTNAVTFGTEVGSGTGAVGVSGNLFKTATQSSACFSITNTDADITAHYFGCQFINSLYEDHAFQAWTHDASAGAAAGFTSRNREANITAVTGTMFPATEANNDAYYVGDRDRGFFGVQIDLSTLGVGTPTLAFEYYNGTAYAAVDALVDGTSGLTADGRITFAKPDDWTAVAAGNTGSLVTAFYFRIRIVSGTFSTNPVVASSRPLFAGLIKFEQANAKAVSGLFSGCGPISVRNGAIIRKCTITDSNAGAVGALDLGGANPSTDTVRDNTVQNSDRGVLLIGTGDTSYTIPGFTFAGNTNDFRVDFGASDTVTITLTDGTSSDTALIPANQDNVNGSTIVFVNARTVRVTVLDHLGVELQNARVLLKAGTGGDLTPTQSATITRVTTTATVTQTAHGMATGDEVAIVGAEQGEYNGVKTITVTGANTYTYTVSGSPTTPATGTITAQAVILNGLTNASGIIEDTGFSFTSAQATEGVVRMSSTSPRYKSSPLSGSITDANGLLLSVQLILDE